MKDKKKTAIIIFEKVSQSFNYIKDFNKVLIDRNTQNYKMLMHWSKVFLMNKSFSTFSGSTNSRALLFPMETIYESFIAQKMKEVMGANGWNVSNQDKGKFLFIEPRKQFGLRPDIVMTKNDRTIILVTKWKVLFVNEHKNYGISQSDMYQMYAYSKKYETSEIWLLYPINSEMYNHSPIHFDSGDGATIKLHFIDLENIESNLTDLRNKLT